MHLELYRRETQTARKQLHKAFLATYEEPNTVDAVPQILEGVQEFTEAGFSYNAISPFQSLAVTARDELEGVKKGMIAVQTATDFDRKPLVPLEIGKFRFHLKYEDSWRETVEEELALASSLVEKSVSVENYVADNVDYWCVKGEVEDGFSTYFQNGIVADVSSQDGRVEVEWYHAGSESIDDFLEKTDAETVFVAEIGDEIPLGESGLPVVINQIVNETGTDYSKYS